MNLRDGSVADLGDGLYVFTGPQGFYMTPFVVSPDTVLVIDPVSQEVAESLLRAIRGVTQAPVETIIYSHDHRDHVVGGFVLGASQVYAHPLARERILHRQDPDVLVPTHELAHGSTLTVGSVTIESRYYGPTHSDSLCPLVLVTPAARHMYFADVLDVGLAPYRNLPDTDLRGLMSSLTQVVAEGGVDRIIGAHSVPAVEDGWIALLKGYFEDLQNVATAEWSSMGGQTTVEGEDGIAMTERVRREACRRVADELRPTYANLMGFDEWAPQNADRMLSMLITGN